MYPLAPWDRLRGLAQASPLARVGKVPLTSWDRPRRFGHGQLVGVSRVFFLDHSGALFRRIYPSHYVLTRSASTTKVSSVFIFSLSLLLSIPLAPWDCPRGLGLRPACRRKQSFFFLYPLAPWDRPRGLAQASPPVWVGTVPLTFWDCPRRFGHGQLASVSRVFFCQAQLVISYLG